MAKKSSGSTPREKLTRVKASDILSKPLTAEEEAQLAALKDRSISYSDIPPLTNEQLARMKRVSREPTKELVAMRLDVDVMAWLRGFGEGYSTRANAILRAVMEQAR